MGVSSYVPEVSIAQEVTFTLSGGLGEAPTGGPQMNIVPRQGGNTYSRHVLHFLRRGGLAGHQSHRRAHRAPACASHAETLKLWDVNGSLGGPIMRDKLWFYWTGRHQGTRQLVAGLWANNNAGDPTKWTYDPDLNRQAKDDGTWKNSSIRFTYQATPRNKIGIWWDEQVNCQSCINSGASGGPSATFAATSLAPEADGKFYNPIRMGQATWTSPVTTRLLLEAGFGLGPRAQFGDKERDDTNPDIIRVNEAAGIIPNLTYRGLTWARNWGEMYTYRGSVSVHHRGAQPEGRRPAAAHQGGVPRVLQQLADALQFRQRHPHAVDDVRGPCGGQRLHQRLHAGVRAGSMDRGSAHAAGRGAVRVHQQLLSRSTHPQGHVRSQRTGIPGAGRWCRTEGHQPAPGRRLRLVRQRKDRIQVQPGSIPDSHQRLRDVRPPAAAVLPRRHDDQPFVERSAPSGRRPPPGQLLT